jgi:hypothetical protein
MRAEESNFIPSWLMRPESTIGTRNCLEGWLREVDSNHRPLAYEASEMTRLLYPAIGLDVLFIVENTQSMLKL